MRGARHERKYSCLYICPSEWTEDSVQEVRPSSTHRRDSQASVRLLLMSRRWSPEGPRLLSSRAVYRNTNNKVCSRPHYPQPPLLGACHAHCSVLRISPTVTGLYAVVPRADARQVLQDARPWWRGGRVPYAAACTEEKKGQKHTRRGRHAWRHRET